MKKVMILGAGKCQVNAINAIKELGHIAIVSDNSETSIGKKLADIKVLADTFSVEESYRAAKDNHADAIITCGTDQPVLTVAKLAKKMNLAMFISEDTALAVTNKKVMKNLFTKHKIPTSSYAICSKDFEDSELDNVAPPYVLKPLDSQGQRGIFKVSTIKEIRDYFESVLSFSREKEIIIESFYKNQEVTVSGWLDNGKCHILTITDRATFSSDKHIGVCISHEYPSIHLNTYRNEFFDITYKICKAFKIKEGPIYFQYLVGDRGVLVNEIACRLGGAFEDITIPYVSSVDVLKMNIEGALDKDYDKSDLRKYSYKEEFCVSTQLFFCDSGRIKKITAKEEILSLDFVLGVDYNFDEGDFIPNTQNASQRAGYVIISGENEEELVSNINIVFDKMQFLNDEGKNIIIRGERNNRDYSPRSGSYD